MRAALFAASLIALLCKNTTERFINLNRFWQHLKKFKTFTKPNSTILNLPMISGACHRIDWANFIQLTAKMLKPGYGLSLLLSLSRKIDIHHRCVHCIPYLQQHENAWAWVSWPTTRMAEWDACWAEWQNRSVILGPLDCLFNSDPHCEPCSEVRTRK